MRVSALLAGAMAGEAAAQQGAWIYDIFVEECRKAGGTPATTREQALRGERFECRRGGSGQSQAGPAASCEREAKENVDWVFRDAGARRTYERHRREGKSAFEAVVGAQGHNRPAQDVLRRCQPWVEAYLAGQGAAPGGVTLGNRPLGAADCRCISVLPTGESDSLGRPGYLVRNTCDGMDVSVRFVGDIARLSPGYGLSSWSQAGLLGPSQERVVRGPAGWTLISIKAVTLRNAAASFTCNF